MKITQYNKCIDIFYDSRCDICSSFIKWLRQQPCSCNVNYVSYQSARAEEWFQSMAVGEFERQLVVRNDSGGMYRGAAAWVQCMLVCLSYADLAERLSSPLLMPVAQKACHLVACNERTLREIFSVQNDEEVLAELEGAFLPSCQVDEMNEEVTIMAGIPDGII
jgi:predicted DCC family thiol-disulfide oxidoreductase YuxK